MAYLVIDHQGQSSVVGVAGTLVIGRHDDCDICLSDPHISRRHARISGSGGRLKVEDLGSTTGTRLNGEVLTEAQDLEHGNLIEIGTARCTVHFAARPGAPTNDEALVTRMMLTPVEQFRAAEELQSSVQLRRDYEKLRISFELSRVVSGDLDVDAQISRILDRLLDLLNADHAVVFLNGSAGELEERGRASKAGISEDVAVSMTAVREAINERQAVMIHDAQVDDRYADAASVLIQGIRSTIAVPLVFRHSVLGALVLDSRIQTHAFSEPDLELAQTAANQLALSVQNTTTAAQLAEEAMQRERFQRLVGPNVAESIVNGTLTVDKVGDQRDVSVVFSDIRGFTSYCETRTPQDIVAILNEYFEEMVEIVFAHGGTLDKFVGDEIMAVFGAPVAMDNHAEQAVSAAVAMQRRTRAMRDQWTGPGESPLKVGIGVNSGGVVAGFLGSSKALDYTVIGDVVNTAARLCSAASADEILIGENSAQGLSDAIEKEPIAPLQVKGKAEPLAVYRVRVH